MNNMELRSWTMSQLLDIDSAHIVVLPRYDSLYLLLYTSPSRFKSVSCPKRLDFVACRCVHRIIRSQRKRRSGRR